MSPDEGARQWVRVEDQGTAYVAGRDQHIYRGAVARSAYLETVRRIAPPELLGRVRELEELASFCIQGPGVYQWWRAGAWAGKSALLSWFVLHPPPGVRVVSFFVTARFRGQSDLAAFTDVVVEQLADLLDQPMPAHWTEATRESHFLALLPEAADTCRRRGQHLVLVVDGLDEDRGVTTGPDAHSIATLLPARPPAGIRIVVAGRPNPPIPSDVPKDHPLRDPEVVRIVDPSEYAEMVREDAERELKHLLEGSPAEQELLGLVTAAGGGLSDRDLAELSGRSIWQIEDHLRTVSGRTFRMRGARWNPDTDVYVLVHEDLQEDAVRYLGEAQLEVHRRRLIAWAEQYRDRGWPQGTPEYLLRGYFLMLLDAGEMAEVVRCATDARRHDRMLDLSGGDGAALGEINRAQDAILAQDGPDLAAMARLAIQRTDLAQRNADLPIDLPAVWVMLRDPARAEAMARSLDSPYRQDQALGAIVTAMAAEGELAAAERMARSIADPGARVAALCAVVCALAAGGDAGRAGSLAGEARTVAMSMTDDAMASRLVEALAAIGDVDAAEALASSITDTRRQQLVFMTIARAVAATGNLALARAMTAKAEAVARLIDNPRGLAWALAELAREAVSVTGDHDRARALAGEAEGLADSASLISGPDWYLTTFLADVAASVGDPERAEALARSITDVAQRARALTALVGAAAAAGDRTRAETLARDVAAPFPAEAVRAAISAGDLTRAEALTRSLSSSIGPDGEVLLDLVTAIAAGDPSRAEALAHSITHPPFRLRALTALSGRLAAAGYLDRARALAQEAEVLARTRRAGPPGGRRWPPRFLANLVDGIAAAGDLTAPRRWPARSPTHSGAPWQ